MTLMLSGAPAASAIAVSMLVRCGAFLEQPLGRLSRRGQGCSAHSCRERVGRVWNLDGPHAGVMRSSVYPVLIWIKSRPW